MRIIRVVLQLATLGIRVTDQPTFCSKVIFNLNLLYIEIILSLNNHICYFYYKIQKLIEKKSNVSFNLVFLFI